jgi:hypothetical protein
VLDQRGQLLRAALGFAGLPRPSYDRALHALRTWLDSWSGIGHVVVSMARQGYDLQLTRYDEKGWRATFYTTGMEHSPTSATGTAWERTPWATVGHPGSASRSFLCPMRSVLASSLSLLVPGQYKALKRARD